MVPANRRPAVLMSESTRADSEECGGKNLLNGRVVWFVLFRACLAETPHASIWSASECPLTGSFSAMMLLTTTILQTKLAEVQNAESRKQK